MLKDNGNPSGTFVNGWRLTHGVGVTLAAGDDVHIGGGQVLAALKRVHPRPPHWLCLWVDELYGACIGNPLKLFFCTLRYHQLY